MKNQKPIGFILASFFFTSLFVWAKPTTTKDVMHKLKENLDVLRKYMAPDKFVAKENSEIIEKTLHEITGYAKLAKHDPRMNDFGFRFSRKVLEEHIAETERVFRIGNKSYARWMLGSTLAVCASCHTQLPTASRSLFPLEEAQTFSSSFEQAEYLFSTRAFDQSIPLFDKVISGFPDNKASTEQLEKSLKRKVAYFARVTRDPKGGQVSLEESLKNKKIPGYVQRNVNAWIAVFREWTKKPTIDPQRATDKEFTSYIEKELKPQFWDKMIDADDPRVVSYLKASGLLYEYLYHHPMSEAKPQLLYWLSICDRRINQDFFFSLADLYLRECITQFPSHPVAKKCYGEYEEATIVSYSGSSGTHLPDDVRVELTKLKNLVEGKKR